MLAVLVVCIYSMNMNPFCRKGSYKRDNLTMRILKGYNLVMFGTEQ